MNDEIIYIGIIGKAGSGKDTFCNMLMDNVGDHVITHRIGLADPLKRVVAELHGVDVDIFHDREKKEQLMTLPTATKKEDEFVITPRKILQQFGTEVIRNMDPDHWVKRFDQEVIDVMNNFNMCDFDAGLGTDYKISRYNYTRKSYRDNKNKRKSIDVNDICIGTINLVIVPDIRFENEQRMVLDKGGYLINVSRQDLSVGDMDFSHASETSIDESKHVEFHINNNKTLSHLYLEAMSVLSQIGLR